MTAGRSLLALALLLVTAASALSQPNIVVLQGDDWGWPYYGFMQRYMAAKITGVCAGGSSNGAPCATNGQCPGGTCASDFVGDDPNVSGREYTDPQLILPSFPPPGAPSVDRQFTPALDWLAANGNFWPVSHNSASKSQPAFAIIMTGLFPLDWVLTADSQPRITSPILPEWLPSTYLTLMAGKFQYATSHVDVNNVPKFPFDRSVGIGGNAGGVGRYILRPYLQGDPNTQALAGLALERVKDFVSCARCSDPSKCAQPNAVDARPDSARMGTRVPPGTCTPQPFFAMLSPFIPHNPPRFDDFCHYYPRDAVQCAQEPWATHSIYCNDPSGFDWACANFESVLEATLRPPNVNTGVNRGKVEYLKHINVFDRMADEMIVHLRCPGGGNPSCGEDLSSNTVFLYRSDHGYQLNPSKGGFSEHSYRSPVILFDPRPGGQLPASPECAGQPGCRNDFAHAVDHLATIKDLSSSTFTCDPMCPPCSPTCPNACPCLRPDGQSRYSEGRSLRSPITRSCDVADPDYLQCLIGREKKGQGISRAEVGWYVLAEIAAPSDPNHLCKLYRGCGRRIRLYDLRSDPNERQDQHGVPGSFCGDRYDELVDILRTEITEKGWYDSCYENGL